MIFVLFAWPFVSIAATSIDTVVHDVKSSAIDRIEVFGAPEVVETNEAVTPEALAALAKHRSTFTSSSYSVKTRFLICALRQAETLPPDQQAGVVLNFRWACLFHSASSINHRVYLDPWSNYGTIDGELYRFGPLLQIWFVVIAFASPIFIVLVLLVLLFVVVICLVIKRTRSRRRVSANR